MSVESIYANVAACECPRCGRTFQVLWTYETAFPRYDERVTCPHCGTRLKVWHEMWPEFYAEVDADADGAR